MEFQRAPWLKEGRGRRGWGICGGFSEGPFWGSRGVDTMPDPLLCAGGSAGSKGCHKGTTVPTPGGRGVGGGGGAGVRGSPV